MNTTLCAASFVLAVMALAVEAGGADTPTQQGKPLSRVQPVIDEVEKYCIEKSVYMIGRKKAERLAELVREKKPENVVECGTAVGYSGLWIARELKRAGKGHLVTMEISPERAKQAEANFRKAGLDEFVTVKVGDARKLTKDIKGPIDFAFIDCGYSNYHPIFVNLQDKLSEGAVVVADNVGIGAGGMKNYLDAVRKHDSRTESFQLDLPWAKRDAMEITTIGKKRGAFLGWPEDKKRTVGDKNPESAVADVDNMTPVQSSTYEQYLERKRQGRITVESFRDGYVYYAIKSRRDVPFPPSEGGPVSAWVYVTERYKAKLPDSK